MNTAAFIAKRIRTGYTSSFGEIAHNLAIISIAIGVAALIIAYSILEGFKSTVREKIFNFNSHIEVSMFDINNSPFDQKPISNQSFLFKKGGEDENIRHIYSFTYAKGILHANEHVFGCLLKGIDQGYLDHHLASTLVEGKLPKYDSLASRNIVISQYIANKLELGVGSYLRFYTFENNKLKPRKLFVSGIYQTHLEEFDHRMVLCDQKMVQRLKAWDDSLVGGYEVYLQNAGLVDETDNRIFDMMDIHMQSEKITDKYAYLFEWLNLLDQNVGLFIIILMIIVFFNISSVMYILSLERNNMIGVLKAIGANNVIIQKVFWFMGVRILSRGLILGNLVALIVCFVQYQWEIIPLDPANYYMESVPVKWVWIEYAMVNILTVLFVLITLFLPIQFIKAVSPMKSIRFQ